MGNLAKAVGEQATEKMRQALSKKSPSEATTMAQDAQAQVIQAMDAQGQNVEAITVMGAAGAGFAKSKAAQPPTGFGMVAKAPSLQLLPQWHRHTCWTTFCGLFKESRTFAELDQW